tara:strand:+ start:1704 stop:2105 length:402 start_codon:yes stop_codon:yes gene_type:complete
MSSVSVSVSFPICCLCDKPCESAWGNNAQPLMSGSCCNECNFTKVIPARIAGIDAERKEKEQEVFATEVRRFARLNLLKTELLTLDAEYSENREIIKNKVKGQIRKAQSRNKQIRERLDEIYAGIAVIRNRHD